MLFGRDEFELILSTIIPDHHRGLKSAQLGRQLLSNNTALRYPLLPRRHQSSAIDNIRYHKITSLRHDHAMRNIGWDGVGALSLRSEQASISLAERRARDPELGALPQVWLPCVCGDNPVSLY